MLEADVFAGLPGLAAAFTTRHGGVSEGPYATLNLGLGTGDEAPHVRRNRRHMAAALGFDAGALALAGQVHGARVRGVVRPGLYEGCDALVTRTPGMLLGILAADCAAVLLADAEGGVVGACHAGWRGAAARIVAATVKAMARVGARPERLRAYVGPCISAERFEVGEEVARQFSKKHVVRRAAWPRPHVDLKAAIAAQILQGGVPAEQTEVSPRCTAAEPGDFFSHRATGGTTGRMMGLIGLRAA